MFITNLFQPQNAGIWQQAFSLMGQISGSNMQARGYRSAITATESANRFNQYVADVNLNRELDTLTRQFQRINSTQKSQMAATGLSSTSRSFLSVMNETMSGFERSVVERKEDAKIEKQIRDYETEVQKVQLSNQASMAKYQSKLGIWQSGTSLFGSIMSAISTPTGR